ncbi:Six-hairpin glycosidase-like protein [Vararia minispora EC-137]|uniref:Six-hairpin glycosidase-like protein n=1 Tax=Vararia minispora EC-137 TaxID=1314806 RepID=A0ACB8QBV3_9AGAM|nr:Six-hairpin glycosidase-like protein [Vararia minispora EC-137]
MSPSRPARAAGLLFLFLSSFFAFACAQDFSVPNNWRKSTSSLSRTERSALAEGALSTLPPLINPLNGTIGPLNFPQTAALISVFAQFDYFNGTTTYIGNATNNLQTFGRLNANFYNNATQFGIAAYYCYRAYNQSYLLDMAVDVWKASLQSMITVADAQNGTHAGRTVSFQSSCPAFQNTPGGTTAGGVFWLVDSPTNTLVNGESIGPFMELSAYLYEGTKNQTYLDIAQLTAEFMRNHMYNGTIILDTFDVTVCGGPDTGEPGVFTYNEAFYIEGLAVLANVTGNSTWTSLVENLAVSTIKFPAWTESDGINMEALLIRALRELWARTQNENLKQLIEAYILVQHNALLDLATVSGSNHYSNSWIGPPVSALLPWGQIAALDVLNSAFDMAAPDGSPAQTQTPESGSPNTPTVRTPMIGAIAGGAVGGAVGATAVVVLGLMLLRRRRRRRGRHARDFSIPRSDDGVDGALMAMHEPHSHGSVEPFLQQAASGSSIDASLGSAAGTRPAVYAPHVAKRLHDLPAAVVRSEGAGSSGGGGSGGGGSSGYGEDSSGGGGSSGGRGGAAAVDVDEEPLPTDPVELQRLWRILQRMQAESEGASEAPPRYEG